MGTMNVDIEKTMEMNGFRLYHTGGGCYAYEKTVGKRYILITNESAGVEFKSLDSIAQIGWYEEEDFSEELVLLELSLNEMLQILPRLK